MLKRIAAIILAMGLIGTSVPAIAGTAKPGQSCTTVGELSGSGKAALTCTSKGLNLVWVKGVAKSLTYRPAGIISSRCEGDFTKLSAYAQKINSYIVSQGKCVGLLKIASMKESTLKPQSILISPQSTSDLSTCKIQAPTNINVWKAFPSTASQAEFTNKRHPSPTTLMQVIAVSAPDAPTNGKTPYQDYKYYFDSLRTYFTQINDGPGNIEIRIPESYTPLNKNIAPYQVEHGKDNDLSRQFATDVISAVDSQYDFSKINYALIIVPAGTPSGVIGQQGWGGIMSQEGRVASLSVAQPATFTGLNNSKTPEMASLGMWIHELYHPGLNLGDNHGDDSGIYNEKRGMGDWGLMSRSNGDLLAWQKWLLGFTQDSQVVCVNDKSQTSITHLAPSSVHSKKKKLVVIPINQTKVLVLESIRNSGLNYKYGSERSGVLAYTVDSADTSHNLGYAVMYPDSRKPPAFSGEGKRYTDASLKYGESLTYEGVKITNVEWGEFGDVIKVEPAK